MHSILVYGAEIWADALKLKKYKRRMSAGWQSGAPTGTISEVFVVAGIIPNDLLAQERKQVYKRKAKVRNFKLEGSPVSIRRAQWQERGTGDSKGRWTARLIKQLAEWTDRKYGA